MDHEQLELEKSKATIVVEIIEYDPILVMPPAF